MKKFNHYALLLLIAVTAFVTSCGNDYDDTALKNDISDLKQRVEKLEKWCETTNSQISALQGLVTALEAKDFVTGVSPIMEGSKEVGYTITFSKSGAITIKHGKDGANGVTPVIGAKKDTDGFYYWTVKTGDADETWMTDADGKKIRTTGDAAQSPEIGVATDTDGKVYWQVNGEWLMSGGNKVQATGDKGDTGSAGSNGSQGPQGPQGDAVFATNGVTVNDDNVEFTLADGTTKFTVPRTGETQIFDSFNNFKIAVQDTPTELELALTIKDADYKAIKAELTSSAGLSTAIQTRATTAPWEVAITAPVFENGTVKTQPKVSITVKNATLGDVALLKVTVIDSKGAEHASTRVIVYDDKVDVESVTIPETLAVNVGEEATLTATVLPAGATQTVTWSSKDETIATVDASGKVTGVKAGTVIITATSTEDATKADECTVTVSTVAVTGITLADAAISLSEKKTLTATITPANATVKTLTWSSSNTAVATVNATTGEVEGKTAGETIITATWTEDSNIKNTCKVTVTEKPSITWATGNLVADGPNSAKIGTATDGGLFFQFGSLIGWSGTEPLAIVVKPANFDETGGKDAWTSTGKIWQGTTGTVPFAEANSENEKAGIGDPCRYYLEGTWRLPTNAEYDKLFKNHGYPNTGPWKWNATSTSAEHNDGLKLPASGSRSSNGSLANIGSYGFYWSASPDNSSNSYLIYFNSSNTMPNSRDNRARGFTVRCVQDASN